MISFSAIGPLPPKGRIVTQTTNACVARMLGQRVRLAHGERRARACIMQAQ